MSNHTAPARPFDLSRDFISGVLPSPPDRRDRFAVSFMPESTEGAVVAAPFGAPLPARHQLRIVEPVSQERGDCAVWSAFRVATEASRLHLNAPFDPSEELGYAEVQRQMGDRRPPQQCLDRGSYPRMVWDMMHRQGIALEQQIPYRSRDLCWLPGPSEYAMAAERKIAGYGRVMQTDGLLLIDEIKRILWGKNGKGHRVQVCFTLFETLNRMGGDGVMPVPEGEQVGHHAMDLDGWDDNPSFWHEGGFWDQNQWWTTWGRGGRMFIPYSVLLRHPDRGGVWREDLWTGWWNPVIQPDPDPQPEPGPTPAPDRYDAPTWDEARRVIQGTHDAFRQQAGGRKSMNAWKYADGIGSALRYLDERRAELEAGGGM